ncbi:MAG: hypothetical protein AAF411_11400 [Myxococcota bacterium]
MASPSLTRCFALSASLCLTFFGLTEGCGDDAVELDPLDAGPEAGEVGVDGAVDMTIDEGRPVICRPPGLLWTRGNLVLGAGGEQFLELGLEQDFCEDLELELEIAPEGIVSASGLGTLESGQSEFNVRFTGLAVGEAVVTAFYVDRLDGERRSAELRVTVESTDAPTCSGESTGTVAPGGNLEGEPAGARIALPEGAANDDRYRVDAFEASLRCAPNQVPDGFRALGPAITFGPAVRLTREVPLTVPVQLGRLPNGRYIGEVQFSYTGPGVTTPRIVPVVSPDYREAGTVTFEVPRLGTYQAVVVDAPSAEREREFTFRAIMGVSMGSSGASLIGSRSPERFDFVGPLGGPVDWVHLLEYVRTVYVGGFCSEAEFQANPEGCGAASTERTPEPRSLYEVRQNYENWFYEDEFGGQGGTFDRRDYVQIFRDLSIMFGNINSIRSTDPGAPNVTPPGVPDSVRGLSNEERCANPQVLAPEPAGGDDDPATGFFDEEYNPEGQYPVITFCEGGETRDDGSRDIGVWEPGPANNFPLEVALAVDRNGNGLRDRGEPVIRQGREDFADCGLDQVCSESEPGYDPVLNPDPAGDDYDFQYNPDGTEGNALRDFTGAADGECASPNPTPAVGVGEPFTDLGMDGVAGTAQLGEGGYDTGEGDGCWTVSAGMARMIERNPRQLFANMSDEQLRNTEIFGDGGVRDLFNFAANQDQLVGALASRGLPVTMFREHGSLDFNGGGREYDPLGVDWGEVGPYLHIRYGNIDASRDDRIAGDGGHVGTAMQILNRLRATIDWMGARWPDGDRVFLRDQLCSEVSDACPNPNLITEQFTSSDGRTGPASIVLPPGYFRPENAERRYPVVYLLHGYGQSPEDLLPAGFVLWSFMISTSTPEAKRLPKMIFVFPDGRCRGDECLRGTFYQNAPPGSSGAQMETFTLELIDFIDENYRTRRPETFTVPE